MIKTKYYNKKITQEQKYTHTYKNKDKCEKNSTFKTTSKSQKKKN